MATHEHLRKVVRQFSKTGVELERLCQQAHDPHYWVSLNSDLTISSTRCVEWGSSEPQTDEIIALAAHSYRTHGFLTLSNYLSLTEVARMRKAVENLVRNDWPPVFSFVYDDFWLIGRSSSIRKLLVEVLHPNYRLLTRLWTHYVRAARGNGGWIPHLDHPNETGHTTSVWIPLSESTLTNGCMYIVKRNEQTGPLCNEYPNATAYTMDQLRTLLKNTRALPASPGSLLCWDEKILHWGGEFEGGQEPRISLALEFTIPEFVTADDQEQLIDPMGPLPSFESRLLFIANALLSYRRFEPMIERFTPMARQLAMRA